MHMFRGLGFRVSGLRAQGFRVGGIGDLGFRVAYNSGMISLQTGDRVCLSAIEVRGYGRSTDKTQLTF